MIATSMLLFTLSKLFEAILFKEVVWINGFVILPDSFFVNNPIEFTMGALNFSSKFSMFFIKSRERHWRLFRNSLHIFEYFNEYMGNLGCFDEGCRMLCDFCRFVIKSYGG